MGLSAIRGVSSASPLVDEIAYLLAHSLLTKITRRWTLLPGFLDALCSVQENDKKVQPIGSLMGALATVDFSVILFYRA